MIVPVSEEVARSVPLVFSAMHDNGDLCASIALTFFRFSASKIKSSPEVGGTSFPDGGAWDGRAPGSSAALGIG